jgi:arylsulfatase A-like enzyme
MSARLGISRYRRAALGLTGLLALVGCGAEGSPAAPKNLLLVVFDTTRADHLGCYGYGRKTSPTVDGLAKDGLLFENAYSSSSLTPVSAGSFLTGTLPYRHGVRSLFVVGEESLAGDVPALFELLQGEGRRTAAFVSARPMGRHYGLARGFEHYDDDMSAVKQRFGLERFADAPQRPGDMTTDLALDWLRANGDRPFAAMVHLFDAHDLSFVPPREFLDRHLDFPLPPELGRFWPHSPLKTIEQLLALYDAEILFMDRQLRRLLTTLEELGVREDTLVVFLADHGESFGEHGYFTHGWLAEEELRVPLVLSGAGVEHSAQVDQRVRTIDLLPTLCELFGIEVPENIDGAPLLGLARGEVEDYQREVYAEVHHAPGDPRGREAAMHTIINGPWKYIHRPASRAHELYHLGDDPAEAHNLFEAKPTVAARLTQKLLERGALGGAAVSLEGLTPVQIRELQSLGYLGRVEEE